mgnify:CR=1 FL=1
MDCFLPDQRHCCNHSHHNRCFLCRTAGCSTHPTTREVWCRHALPVKIVLKLGFASHQNVATRRLIRRCSSGEDCTGLVVVDHACLHVLINVMVNRVSDVCVYGACVYSPPTAESMTGEGMVKSSTQQCVKLSTALGQIAADYSGKDVTDYCACLGCCAPTNKDEPLCPYFLPSNKTT